MRTFLAFGYWLLAYGYIDVEDLSRGKITEKANRETIAAARHAATRRYREVTAASLKSTTGEAKKGKAK